MSTEPAPQLGLTYFLPPQNWFWQWQEQGRVIAWHDGVTIAFRDELETILKHLVPQGWPPLGSLVLLLAACRDSWSDSTNPGRGPKNLLMRWEFCSSSHELADGLDRVRALPEDLRRSVAARAELAAMVFETDSQCTSDATARQLLAAWPQWRAEELEHSLREPSLGQFQREVSTLLRGLAKVDEHTLRLRMQTGLEMLPEPAEVEPERAQTARALLDQLVDDPELCGVAHLAKHLLAVVSLPRPVSDPTELPEGGVSDISNRGPLDRLLLSELAHDETTLAVRIALNEALYYRRETPPSPPPRARKLLLDSGVRMWGVPRVFAAAVGLALAASPEKKLETAAFRATGRFLEEADFKTRDGLAAHLAALETSAHPGEALDEFRAEVDDDPNAAEGVLITCDDALEDPEFQRQLAQASFDLLYVATVSREGRYRLIARSRRGVKVLREATLDLDRLLAIPPRRPKLIDESHTIEPMILSIKPFPLLLSVTLEVERSWHVEGAGVFTYTRDGRLLHWTQPNLGGCHCAEGLPQGRLFACQSVAVNGKLIAVIGKQGPNGLHAVQIDLQQQHVSWTRLQFPQSPELPVAIHNNKVLLRYGDHVTAVDALSGEAVANCPISGFFRAFGRIVERRGGFGCIAAKLAFDGSQLVTAPLGFLARCDEPPLAVFEVAGNETIAAITTEGQIRFHHPDLHSRIDIKHGLHQPLRCAGVSRDGRRFLLAGGTSYTKPSTISYALVDVQTGAVRAAYGDMTLVLEPYIGQYMRPVVLRSKFVGIGLSPTGQLALLGRKRLLWPIELDRQNNVLKLVKTPLTDVPVTCRTFESVPDHPHGFSLQIAKFPDGTTAWLDGRGLLHLRSSNPELPEVTLVLTDSTLAGWLSDGRVFGPTYFHGQSSTVSANEVYDTVLRPLIWNVNERIYAP